MGFNTSLTSVPQFAAWPPKGSPETLSTWLRCRQSAQVPLPLRAKRTLWTLPSPLESASKRTSVLSIFTRPIAILLSLAYAEFQAYVAGVVSTGVHEALAVSTIRTFG